MPTYILFSTLTPEGRQTLHANPDRVLGVNKEVEEFGCKVIAQYATLGQFDFVTIVEANDSETVAHLSIDLGSRGTVNVTSFRLCRSKVSGPSSRAMSSWLPHRSWAERTVGRRRQGVEVNGRSGLW